METMITNEKEALAAIRENRRVLAAVPPEFRTAEVCMEAVKANSLAVSFVPEKLLTEELCREACPIVAKSYGEACMHIPPDLQSEEFFVEAVTVNENGKALKHVPAEYRTLAVCLAAFARHPDKREEILGYVPEELKAQVESAIGQENSREKRKGERA